MCYRIEPLSPVPTAGTQRASGQSGGRAASCIKDWAAHRLRAIIQGRLERHVKQGQMFLGQLPNVVQEGSGVRRDGTQMVTEGSLTKGLPRSRGGGRVPNRPQGRLQSEGDAFFPRSEGAGGGSITQLEGESPRGRLPGRVWPPPEELSPPREGLGVSGPTSFSLTSILC